MGAGVASSVVKGPHDRWQLDRLKGWESWKRLWFLTDQKVDRSDVRLGQGKVVVQKLKTQ